jgi:hypothetical protein
MPQTSQGKEDFFFQKSSREAEVEKVNWPHEFLWRLVGPKKMVN